VATSTVSANGGSSGQPHKDPSGTKHVSSSCTQSNSQLDGGGSNIGIDVQLDSQTDIERSSQALIPGGSILSKKSHERR
jgi:ABC-type phosphate transport system substrate-binding protein